MLILLVALLAAAACMILMKVTIHVAEKIDLVDRPDGRRKIHDGAIPLAGGMAIYATLMIALALLHVLSMYHSTLGIELWQVVAAATVICFIGILDDMRLLRARFKLLGQFLAVGIIVCQGVDLQKLTIFNQSIVLGPFAELFVAFLLLGAMNSLNLLDGMDGFLGVIGTIMALSLLAAAILTGNSPAAFLSAAMVGALVGFLYYNFPPARVYMGDSGSMLIGLMIGVLAVQASLKKPMAITLITPLAILVLPILDAAAAIVRRKLTGRSIFETDRSHLHHCLQRADLTPRRVLVLVAMLCIIGSAGGVLSLKYGIDLFGVGAGILIIGLLVVLRLFGHSEYLLIRKRFAALLRGVSQPSNGGARVMAIHLQGQLGWDRIWSDLIREAEASGLRAVHLDVNAPALHECFHARWQVPKTSIEFRQAACRIELPLSVGLTHIGQLELAGDPIAACNETNMKRLLSIAQTFQEAIDEMLQPSDATAPDHVHQRIAQAEVKEVAVSQPANGLIMTLLGRI